MTELGKMRLLEGIAGGLVMSGKEGFAFFGVNLHPQHCEIN